MAAASQCGHATRHQSTSAWAPPTALEEHHLTLLCVGGGAERRSASWADAADAAELPPAWPFRQRFVGAGSQEQCGVGGAAAERCGWRVLGCIADNTTHCRSEYRASSASAASSSPCSTSTDPYCSPSGAHESPSVPSTSAFTSAPCPNCSQTACSIRRRCLFRRRLQQRRHRSDGATPVLQPEHTATASRRLQHPRSQAPSRRDSDQQRATAEERGANSDRLRQYCVFRIRELLTADDSAPDGCPNEALRS